MESETDDSQMSFIVDTTDENTNQSSSSPV